MRIVRIAAMSGCLLLPVFADAWRIDRGASNGSVHFQIDRASPGAYFYRMSLSFPQGRIQGLPDTIPVSGSARFVYTHDAGNLLCEGKFGSWLGLGALASGGYRFEPNDRFGAELRKLGYEAPSGDQAFHMAVIDVSLAFARAAREAGYRFSTTDLISLRAHGVDVPYLRRLHDSGMRNLNAEQISKLKTYDVD